MSVGGESASVAVALAEFKGAMETGFATINGSLNLLAQRNDQTDAKLSDHETRLDAVERGETPRQQQAAARLEKVEAAVAERRWPVQSVTALVAVAGLGVSAWSALGK